MQCAILQACITLTTLNTEMKEEAEVTPAAVSIYLAPNVVRALDQMADDHLESRSSLVRRLVVQHLRATGKLPVDAPVTRMRRAA